MTFGLCLGTLGLMPRIIFPGNAQVEYLKIVKSESGLNSDQLAIICGVAGRSFRDWARGKLSISHIALTSLQSRFPQIEVPKSIKIVDDYWYTAKGGRKGLKKPQEPLNQICKCFKAGSCVLNASKGLKLKVKFGVAFFKLFPGNRIFSFKLHFV